jgi:hypothetical protein
MKRWGWPGHGAAIQVCVAVTAAVGVVMLSTYINKQARCVPSSRLLAPIEREGEREREREELRQPLDPKRRRDACRAHAAPDLAHTPFPLLSLSPLTSHLPRTQHSHRHSAHSGGGDTLAGGLGQACPRRRAARHVPAVRVLRIRRCCGWCCVVRWPSLP